MEKMKKAFTIIELLVVISVISLLMAIALPCLGTARKLSRSIVCLSNLRQMTISANIYTNDNKGRFPLAGIIDHDNFSVQKQWDYFKVFNAGSISKCEPGFLWQGGTMLKIQQCPAFKGNANSAGDPYTGYNYNVSYIGGLLAKFNGTTLGSDSCRVIDITRPDECVIFGDGQFANGANKYMRSPQTGRLDVAFGDFDRYSGAQGYRHLKKTNAAFCDGSVASISERFTETANKILLDDFNKDAMFKVGFLSADNSLYDTR